MTTNNNNLEDQLVSRIVKHLLISLGGGGVGLILIVASAFLAKAMNTRAPVVVGFIIGIILIPTIGLTAAFKYLRCPACDRSVWFQTATKMSIFARGAPNECLSCGKTIFADRFRRFRVIFLVVTCGSGLVLGLLVPMLSGGHR